MNLEEIKQNRSYIYYLNKKQMNEPDYFKKKTMNEKLKVKLEEILEIIPFDTSMLIILMYVNINLGYFEEARTMGYQLYEKTQTKDVLNGIAIAEEKLKNYEKALEFFNQMLEREPNNEYIKAKIERVKREQNEFIQTQDVSSKQYQYKQIADLERKVTKMTEQEQKDIVLKRT